MPRKKARRKLFKRMRSVEKGLEYIEEEAINKRINAVLTANKSLQRLMLEEKLSGMKLMKMYYATIAQRIVHVLGLSKNSAANNAIALDLNIFSAAKELELHHSLNIGYSEKIIESTIKLLKTLPFAVAKKAAKGKVKNKKDLNEMIAELNEDLLLVNRLLKRFPSNIIYEQFDPAILSLIQRLSSANIAIILGENSKIYWQNMQTAHRIFEEKTRKK